MAMEIGRGIGKGKVTFSWHFIYENNGK